MSCISVSVVVSRCCPLIRIVALEAGALAPIMEWCLLPWVGVERSFDGSPVVLDLCFLCHPDGEEDWCGRYHDVGLCAGIDVVHYVLLSPFRSSSL